MIPIDREEARKILQENKIEHILAQYVDIHGSAKMKMVPVSHFDDLVDSGAGFAGAAVWGVGMGPHDPDMMAIPDLDSLTIIPWQKGVARFVCDIHVDGQPWPYCSRLALKRVIKEAEQMGYVLNVGIEPEFFLVKKNSNGEIVPADDHDNLAKPCYDFKGLSNSMDFLSAAIHYMILLGWDVYQCDHEDGNGQFEINFVYTDCLTTSDRFILFKMLITTLARQYGAIATFMAKPFPFRTGNSAHFHQSLVDVKTGQNLFLDENDPRGFGLSKLAYHFIGGLKKHAKALTAVCSPCVNSYKRLVVGSSASGFTWAPVFVSYGGNNRTVMLRIPGPGRVECRTVDSTCNPYLASAALLEAGLDGIKNQIEAGEPTNHNMYDRTPEQVSADGIEVLPDFLLQALEELENDPVIISALGEPLAEEFLRLKRQEWKEYHSHVSSWEIDRYLEFY